MSKKDRSQDFGTEQNDGMDEASRLEEFKAKKRAAAARFKESRQKEKEERVAKAKSFIDDMKSAGLWEQMPENDRAFIEGLANPSSGAVSGGTSLLAQLFGPNPQPGATITLNEAFEKTLKGKSNIDHYVKKWAEKGIVVTFQQDTADIRKSTYTIESIA